MKKEIIAKQLVKIAKTLVAKNDIGKEQLKKIVQYFQKVFAKSLDKDNWYFDARARLGNNIAGAEISLRYVGEGVVFYYDISFEKSVRQTILVHNVEQLKKAIKEFKNVIKKQMNKYVAEHIKNFDNEIFEVTKKLDEVKDLKKNFWKDINELDRIIQGL